MIAKRQLLAILSGDVVGYSRLMAEDEETTIAALADLRETVATEVIASHGRIVDFVGDNFLAEFGSALHAIQCATRLQRAIEAWNATIPVVRQMRFRIGAHVGDVRIEDDRLYGDAVNVASRLEGLASPGGICLSQQILDQVSGQLAVHCRDLGEQQLKNIARSIRAYHHTPSQAEADAPEPVPVAPTSGPPLASARHGIPKIAVLPIAALAPDREQAGFTDAMTMDIITGLSCDRRFSVIAYNSVQGFKGTERGVAEIGEALGARYVVRGSARRTGSKVRIAMALIEADSQRELWGQRFDRDVADLFDVFDDLVEAIVTALASQLKLSEEDRYRRRRPEQIDAWALATQAMATRGWIGLDASIAHAQQALEVDRNYAYAWAVLGFLTAFRYPMGLSCDHAADIADSLRQTDTALALDARDPWNLVAKSVALQYAGRPGESLSYLERSLRLNPSDVLAHCYYGRGLMFAGRPALAIPHFERLSALNPLDPDTSLAKMYHAMAWAFLGRWEEAEQTARVSLAACGGRNPWSWAFLAMAVAAQDRSDDASSALTELGRVAPHWTRGFVVEFLRRTQEDEVLLKRLLAVLEKMPDQWWGADRGIENT